MSTERSRRPNLSRAPARGFLTVVVLAGPFPAVTESPNCEQWNTEALSEPLLRAAAYTNDPSVVLLLTDAGADVNAGEGVQTPLHRAIGSNTTTLPTIQTLLDAGGDVEARDRRGNTALHHTVLSASSLYKRPSHYATVAQLLLQAGADMDARNNFDWTVSEAAEFYWPGLATSVFNLLRNAVAKGNSVSIGGQSQQQAGEVFRDCDLCPQMVVVPPGTYMMGRAARETEAMGFEEPQHRVTIEYAFAVGVFEVTFDEWDACVRGGGCGGQMPPDLGWGRGRHPVINVGWEDAWDYANWLTEQTGEEYRLLSEAEWEYVARAGTRTARYWGDAAEGQCMYANGYDTSAHDELARDVHAPAPCRDGWTFTAPVGSFRPNGFGLYDMLGNVREWVDDCFTMSYEGASTDGSAWHEEDCLTPVLRGGSWLEHEQVLRSASRMRTLYGRAGSNTAGVRVARSLTSDPPE